MIASLLIAPLLTTTTFAGAIRTGDNAQAAERLKSESIVLKAGAVHSGDGSVFAPGIVVLLDGKIVAVGKVPPLAAGSREIDCGDSFVITAGLVDAACQLGTDRREGFSEQSSEVIPHLDVADSIDFYSEDFEKLARDGVTTVYITPEASSVIGSRGAAVKTAGPIAERRLQAVASVKANLGPESSRRGSFNSSPSRFGTVSFNARRPTTRMGAAWVFRHAFHEALVFKETGATEQDPAAMRALLDVMSGAVKLRFQARQALDIRSAQRLCDEFGLTFTLEYGNDVAHCLDLVTARKIPVIFGPLRAEDSLMTQFSGDDFVTAYTTPRLLAEQGVTFCLTACDGSGEGGLARQAGLAIRHGLDRARALRAVTTDPAALLGLEKRIGSLAAGMDADLVVWNGQPFDDSSRPVLVLVNGRPVHDPDGRLRKEIQ